MKTTLMNWIIAPGIVICFATFVAVFSLGLIDIMLINVLGQDSDLSGAITPSGFFFGYCCAALAINIDFLERLFK